MLTATYRVLVTGKYLINLNQIRKLNHIQKYEGKLHFATDAWTSPNHQAYVALTVHFEHNGAPVCLILDVVEVAKVSEMPNISIIILLTSNSSPIMASTLPLHSQTSWRNLGCPTR